MRTIRLITYCRSNWITSINSKMTDTQIKDYFLNNNFNISNDDINEKIVKVEKIEVLNSDTNEVIRVLK